MRKLLSLLLPACILISLLTIPAAAATAVPSADAGYSAYEWETLRLTNKERAANGREPQTMIPKLQQAAHIRADELVGTYSHTRPDGTSCFTVYGDVGLSYNSVAENIATGYKTPAEVVNAWIGSNGHHTNMISASTVHSGVGYRPAGQYGTSWVQIFQNDNCSFTSLTVSAPPGGWSFPAGTAIDDFGGVVHLKCSVHGDTVCPLTVELCSGYDSSKPGTQTVAVTAYGLHTSINVKVTAAPAKFADIRGDEWFAPYVSDLAGRGVITGSTDENGRLVFRPQSSVTRAEFVTLLARAAGQTLPASGGNDFSDVPASHWAARYVAWAFDRGIVSRGEDRLFRPQDTITRQELATMLYRWGTTANKLPAQTNAAVSFSDQDKIASWATQAVFTLQRGGVISGVRDGSGKYSFLPQKTATRAEATKMLSAFLTVTGS